MSLPNPGDMPMNAPVTVRSVNSWLAIDRQTSSRHGPFSVGFAGKPHLFQGVAEGDWFLLADTSGAVTRVARVFRIRSELGETTFHFDSLLPIGGGPSLSSTGLAAPTSGSIARIQWSDFVTAVRALSGKEVADIPLIDDRSHVRRLLELAVTDDLLGPANGPHEQIVDMGVRDRYLVGKLAPRESAKGGIEGLEGPLAADKAESSDNLRVHSGRHEAGAEFAGTSGRVDATDDATDEIDAASNQSLVPSSFGMTFCVDGGLGKLEVEARWGRYQRDYETEIFKTRRNRETGADEQGAKAKVWQRIPCGGPITLPLTEGPIAPMAPDRENPEVRIQGAIRSVTANGDRLVTLFLVNTQTEPDENRDAAWVFQPELIVCAADGAAIFRRRVALTSTADDPERDGLEMIYREQVEFAVGHGIAVHAVASAENPGHAVEIRTVVMPRYEVPVTETPGSRPGDRDAMRGLVDAGHLDMTALAEMDRVKLADILAILTNDYQSWIATQAARIGSEMAGYDAPARAALARCERILERLEEGVAVLTDPLDGKALAAFRFANRAMASQRIHSLYALSRRRGEDRPLAEFDIPRNRSWRPFQLAFILLSIPSLANPLHQDRTDPMDALADLLWFPTGGGKTEAYLGVAAFAMAVRRLQGDLGGYDGSRGLTVIMRYTLRLLTLQQFQRGATLLCAMEVLRREASAAGDTSLGAHPFTIGLWVGNRVTPGTTADSHTAINDFNNPDRFDAGGASPAQLTSCPWCGTQINPGAACCMEAA